MLSLLTFLVFSFLSVSSQAFSRSDLMTGDVLLQSVPCYLCRMIEIEESTPYSHSGVVIKEGSEFSVLEAWNDVQKVSLSQHLALRKKNTSTLVLRPIDSGKNFLKVDAVVLLKIYKENFERHHYDSDFLWTNQDARGETFYCSEFVAKLLNFVFPSPLLPKPMHFTHYRGDWLQYFHGYPPDGKLGISPGDLERSELLKSVGYLE